MVKARENVSPRTCLPAGRDAKDAKKRNLGKNAEDKELDHTKSQRAQRNKTE